MTNTSVAANFHQPLDVESNVLPEITLDASFFLDDLADLANVVFAEVLDPDVAIDLSLLEDFVRTGATDTKDIGETDFHSLVKRQVNS